MSIVTQLLCKQELEQQKRELEVNRKKLREQITQEMRKQLFQTLIIEKDYFSEIVATLSLYQQISSTDRQLNNVIKDLIKDFCRIIKIEQVKEVGDEVIYDPVKYQSDQKLKKGAPSIVIRPGWQLSGTDEKVVPVVKAKSEAQVSR